MDLTESSEARQRSGWIKGGIRLGLLVVLLACIYIFWPEARRAVVGAIWFVVISAILGVGIAALLRWWNERKPVTSEEEEGIRLHLNDDGPK